MTLQQQIRSNRLRTGVVILGFAALVVLLLGALGVAGFQPGLLGLVGIGAIAYGVVSYFASGSLMGRK